MRRGKSRVVGGGAGPAGAELTHRILDRVAPEYAAELLDRFLALEQELAAHPDTRIAPRVREGLRALGYAP